MKKSISFILCICLVFSSFSFCFASATSWDTSDQANLRAIKNLLDSGGGIYNMISTISSTTNTISNNLNTIKGYLFDSGHSVAYWLSAIDSFMNPILNAIQQTPLDLEKIYLSLGYNTDSNNDGNLEYHSYLAEYKDYLRGVGNYGGITSSSFNKILDAHNGLPWSSGAWYSVSRFLSDGTSYNQSINWSQGSPIGNLAVLFNYMAQNMTNIGTMLSVRLLTGSDSTQNVLNWGNLSTSTFTPSSTTDGIYKYLTSIQAPVARLSYVLASDERIEAQDLSAANEQAVVDNFIDSNGSGAASTSDFDSIADFSDGYKNTFTSDASPTAIFSIFSSDHMGWFSQETKNQLDTTSNNRNSKSSESSTPLLDKQIEDIYNSLGVKMP